MNFLFAEHLGIEMDLSILKRNTQRNRILLYQHEGKLHADANRIGNAEDVTNEFKLFFEKAHATACDLALAPEYSCPFSAIAEIIAHPGKWPAAGKLWVMGCESMNKEQLANCRELNGNDIFLHFEETILHNNRNYADPLVLMFRGTHIKLQKLIVLIQCKTYHMGVWSGAIERDNLIQGDAIYILRNSQDSIYFMSLICSEAMDFQKELDQNKQQAIQWIDKPYLIFNPQLNPDPAHKDFAAFREFVFGFERKEIISLNWNIRTTYHGKSFLKYDTARSGFYVQSHEIDLSKARVKQNHKNGLYYFYFGRNKHAFLLNSTPALFIIDSNPVHIVHGVAPQIRRDGPEVIQVFNFNGEKSILEIVDSVNDAHIDYLQGIGCNCDFLRGDDKCILEKEMLVSLTSGKIEKAFGDSWSSIENIFSFNFNDDSETNRRITFSEDTYVASIEQRTNYVDAIAQLINEVLPNKDLYPESIASLKADDLVIGYNNTSKTDNYKFNVLTVDGQRRVATICFLGSAPDDKISKTFDFLQEMFEGDNNNKRRVVVFFRRGQNILAKSDPREGNITATNDFDGPTILKQ